MSYVITDPISPKIELAIAEFVKTEDQDRVRAAYTNIVKLTLRSCYLIDKGDDTYEGSKRDWDNVMGAAGADLDTLAAYIPFAVRRFMLHEISAIMDDLWTYDPATIKRYTHG